MNTEDFSDSEWQDVLDEFRLLVVRAGYTDWDASAMEALADEIEDGSGARHDRVPVITPVEQLRRYAGAFMRYLKARSRYARDERFGQLGNLLHTEGGAPVEDFLVDFEGRDRPIFAGEDDPDGMIDVLARFLAELNGEDGTFWDNGPDGLGDEA
jgi:hypothetical protein